jgi:D-alanyl-D-alanine carboxypeptidase (penicillin-binding protein 5/6)
MISSFLSIYAAIALGTSNPIATPAITPYEATLPVSMIPVKVETAVEPVIEAKSAIIVDFDSGTIIYERNQKEKLQIASITKLMTAIVALEEGNLDDVVTISQKSALTEGSKIWLLQGEQVTLRNLLQAILIHSGNDAAVAIAEHIADDVPSFIDKMNEKAKRLALYSTHFENPIGFDAKSNYSTVSDLALLARYAFRNPFIREAVRNQSRTIASTDGGITHDLESTNKLLDSFLNVLGLKTGHTDRAGLCFVSVIKNGRGNKIITVVLDSPQRFNETKMLASWAFRSYIW